ncbi:hypothetical protein PENANT_c002G09456 [Penicillium antarcticum]|uniref:ABC transporter domain-containing protein n=1 Tax=Penicillium antarcticum TaxID=416450 RepID=A0A1V6QLD0_9EURO|nr:hypothetical protein PENANT_c002G09456 [Penicillium antarcticum]
MAAAPQDSVEESGGSLQATESRPGALDPGKTRQVYSPITDQDEAVISRIATTLSVPPGAPGAPQAPLNTIEEDDVMNPSSVRFEPYKWAQRRLRQLDEEGVLRQHAGVVFKDLNVSGSGAALQLQNTVDSVLLAPFRSDSYRGLIQSSPKRQILHSFDGVLKSGEMLMVLGRPGSGCSTFQKAICGELHGLNIHPDSTVHYNGISREKMHAEFKGECVYNQEVDKHFPHLTVGETLEFAAAARTPSQRLHGVSRYDFIKETSQVIMAVLGLSHTYNTRVGNDYIRGVSGGERKRVSIAEMALARAPIAAWDNSTRGLDAASALEFVKALRISADLIGSCHAVATYQASQAIYDVFDKVLVLYEGRQIYYGSCTEAEKYFTSMGWVNPPRQTTGDFLTSITNPQERKARSDMEDRVPRTPQEFEQYWKRSPEYTALLKEISQYEAEYPLGGCGERDLAAAKHSQQAKHVRPQSPYIISIPMQLKLCTKRAYQRIWNDKASTLTLLVGRIVVSLIVGSIFFNTPNATAGFFAKGSVLFFAVLLNALISVTEINSLYDQRSIVEKQASYAFVHPFAEALGGMIADFPIKLISAAVFNVVLYFLGDLRYTASQFFIFFLFSFLATMIMSGIFRTLAALTRTVAQAMALAGVMILGIVIYAGFVVPVPEMHPWFSWIRWINPLFYCFESLIANEFHGQEFECSQFIPGYPSLPDNSFVCSIPGAISGARTVSGDAFIYAQYRYTYSHEWRNLGILIAFWIFFASIYLIGTELNSASTSAAEFLIYRRGHVPKSVLNTAQDTEKAVTTQPMAFDIAAGSSGTQPVGMDSAIPEHHGIVTWQNLCYDIPVKGGERRLLDNVSGWVKPGTLTALMGVSGAGKTTLLDVLAKRVSIGIVTGDMLVNGSPLPANFQRETGYVQQQDVHLPTSTVREALRFSAMLRQPKSVAKKEKFSYVEQVIRMLRMEDFAEAVVGSPGEGLNVEQRKLLTIGVELAAKPEILLFLDEPTSGLDSQSAWSICAFLRKLADNGQAVLSTIHQPSAILFQQFDRLLFLAKGGKTVYFGNIGEQSRVLLDYFERNGARKCVSSENPAEYMLEIIGAGAAGHASKDWPVVWKHSPEAREVEAELLRIHTSKATPDSNPNEGVVNRGEQNEFAMPLLDQIRWVTYRVFQQYWREPSYIGAKFMLGIVSALFIGFSYFKPGTSIQGIQNHLFSSFMLTSIFSTLVQQIMPKFVTQRSLYEVRERPSKAYSWAAFIASNIAVEIPYQILLGILVWASYYYPIYGASQDSQVQALMLLFVIQFFVFTSTFAGLVISALPDAETGGTVATLAFTLILTFNGVMQTPTALPGFWIFMYRVSPLTYLVAGMCGNALHSQVVQCSNRELNVFNPPEGQTCGQYLADWLAKAPGQLYNPSATQNCEYCAFTNADQYLALSKIYYDERWRNWGLGWAYIGFNIAAAAGLYYLFRVRHYRPTLIVRVLGVCGGVLHRLFKRRSGKVPRGKEAENGRVV